MSKAPLPYTVDPRRAADQGRILEGEIQLEKLERLCSYLVDSEGTVDVDLTFGVDEERVRYIKGHAETTVRMLCQRCLEPVTLELEAEMNLGIVADDEAAKQLPRYYDPNIIKEPKQDLYQLVEEELILTLPLIAQHENCVVKTEYGEVAPQLSDSEKENPFNVLVQLKTKKH
ncbi:MAG: YceD family protein [Halopseudomonas sp.]